MAGTPCDLTRGRGLGGCLTTQGGVKNVYLADFATAVTADTASEMTTFDGVANEDQNELKLIAQNTL